MTEQAHGRLVARIGRPHGLRGEVTVQVHTDDPRARFVPGVTLRTEASAGSGVPKELTLATARLHREIWLLGFAEVPDRTGAEGLRGTRLLLDEPDLPPDGEDSGGTPSAGDDEGYYEEELVGLRVESTEGHPLGTVSGLLVGSAQDLLEIDLPDGRTALVPFVEQIVPVVDLEGGRLVLDPPAGLLDLAE